MQLRPDKSIAGWAVGGWAVAGWAVVGWAVVVLLAGLGVIRFLAGHDFFAGRHVAGPVEAASAGNDGGRQPAADDLSTSGSTPGRSSADSFPAYLQTNAIHSRLARLNKAIDPSQDGWPSEAFAASTDRQFRQLARQLAEGAVDADQLASIAIPDVVSSSLRPRSLGLRFKDAAVKVFRTPKAEMARAESARENLSPNDQASTQAEHRGRAGLARALNEMCRPLAKAKQRRFAQKTIAVHTRQATWTSRHLVEFSGSDADRTVEQHAVWQCRWRIEGNVPRLSSLHVDQFEETISPAQKWFRDETETIVGHTPTFQRQLVYGLNHWLPRIETSYGMYAYAEYGLAVGDVNGDGLEDLYVCQPGGLPNRLLVQNADATVTDDTVRAGVDWLDHTSSALLVDLDNDADQDLVLAIENRRLLLMRNDGQGQFRLELELPIADRHVQSLSAVDYDQDGRLDLYVTVGFADHRARPTEPRSPFVYHDANEGGANALFRNESAAHSWRFRNVTQAVGLDVNNRRHSLAASWEDYDNDGDQDLYVANDYGQNCLYRNAGGTFQEVAARAHVVDHGSGMSVSWGDYDRDGWMDLYVGNMFSAAGRRITSQAKFRQHADPRTRALLARFAKGNTLFRHAGREALGFEDVSTPAAVQMGRWAWSSVFADINNDGWDDLLVANGYITADRSGDL